MTAKYVSPHGYSDDYGPNVADILVRGTRVIRGRVPAQVRAQLREAVRDGVLGRLPKAGLKPEVFFHPDRKNGAKELQAREAAYAVGCIATVMATPEQRVHATLRSLGIED